MCANAFHMACRHNTCAAHASAVEQRVNNVPHNSGSFRSNAVSESDNSESMDLSGLRNVGVIGAHR